MRIRYITNIPSPYRIEFFNMLGHHIDLSVVYEAKKAKGIKFDLDLNRILNFTPIFLMEDEIKEKHFNLKIIKYIFSNEYDYLVFTNYAYFTEMLAIILAKILRKKYCFEIDGGIVRNENSLKFRLKKILLRGAIRYFSPSIETDDFLKHYGVDDKKIVRYPFSSSKNEDLIQNILSKEEKQKIRIKNNIKGDFVVLSIGQIIHRKGFDILLEASCDFDEKTSVYIIGNSYDKAYFDFLFSKSKSNIYFLDFMNKEQLKEYYLASNLFVLATREDVWGLVINEAMSNGLPVITTTACVAGKELVENGNNGYLVEPEDSKSITSYVNLLKNNEKICTSFGMESLKKINGYTIEKMVDAHILVFQRLEKE